MPYSTPTAAELTKQKAGIRESLPDTLDHRLDRALSWIARAEREVKVGDPDAAFIFYWIAFNAAYARDRPRDRDIPERDLFNDYFRTLLRLDSKGIVSKALWGRFSGSVRLLLENQYVYQPFWSHHAGGGYEDWEQTFKRSTRTALKALADGNALRTLNILFDRLYTLRIQLMHGGATWNGRRNRTQVKDGAKILSFLVPVFVRLMMEHPKAKWGPIDYIVLQGD